MCIFIYKQKMFAKKMHDCSDVASLSVSLRYIYVCKNFCAHFPLCRYIFYETKLSLTAL